MLRDKRPVEVHTSFYLIFFVYQKKQINLQKKSVEEQLILVVSKHYRFGWKFNIHWAKTLSDKGISITGVPSIKVEEQKEMPEINLKLIKLIAEVSDESLMKSYSRQKNRLDFMNEVTQKTIDNLIRPRIELNIRKVIHVALQSSLPVYLRIDLAQKTLYPHHLISLLSAPSTCVFNFVKDKKGLRYFITLTSENLEIALQQKPAFILSEEPCVVLLGDKIHRVENIDSKKLTPFFDKTHISVPAASEKMYINNFILKTIPKYEVKIEGIEMTEIFPSRQAILVLEEDFFMQLTLFLYFQYNHHKINPALRKTIYVELAEINGIETICRFKRDLDWENRLINILLDLGLRKEGENRFYPKQNPEIIKRYGLIEWLNINSQNLTDFTIEQPIGTTYYTGTITFLSKIDITIDWFDLEIEVVLDKFSIPLSNFRKHILNGIIEYVLPDRTVFILPEAWFHRYQPLFLHGKETEKGVRLPKMHIGLLNESISDLFSEKKKQELQKYKQLPAERPALSSELNMLLRPYQKEGFYWLKHLNNNDLGGCLADDMGLGKTLQTITLLDYIYECRTTLPASLIVVPKTLLHNWQNELKKFAPGLKVYMYAGDKRIKSKEVVQLFDRYEVVITSYSLVRADIDYLNEYPFHYIILDESQTIKNPDSILYQCIKNLLSSHKLTLTGTPIENSLSDLWAQFNFINPGLLGTLAFFKNNYVQKIKENNKRAKETLQQLIQPLFLRRTKDEVALDLPPLSQEIVFCDMTESQQETYEIEKNRIRNVLLENKDNPVKNNFIALQGLLRLRLLANHPSLLTNYPRLPEDHPLFSESHPPLTANDPSMQANDPSLQGNYPSLTATHPPLQANDPSLQGNLLPQINSEKQEESGKFDQIILYFESIKASGHKVLIFSSFVRHLKLLSGRFDEEGWKYAMLTGQTSNREAEIEKFTRNDDVQCFFISLKAGGLGLNLTAADYVFIIDPWWNPAAEMQAFSRAHRIGQTKNVMVYRFISSDTIEEKIIRLQQAKLQLSEAFIPSNNPLEQLSNQEIEELFL